MPDPLYSNVGLGSSTATTAVYDNGSMHILFFYPYTPNFLHVHQVVQPLSGRKMVACILFRRAFLHATRTLAPAKLYRSPARLAPLAWIPP